MMNTYSSRPVVFGEVLFDRFDDGSSVLGGAPFNVAWHLQGFGLNPLFISRVGDDTEGRQVLDAMQAWGMDTRGVQIDRNHPTGAVEVALEDGQPTFDILPERAYDFIELEPLRTLLADHEPGVLYHGSLIARSDQSRDTLFALIRLTRMPVFIDINLRAPWWDRERVARLIDGARWCKLNADELAAILQIDANGRGQWARHAQDFCRTRNLELLVLTLGSEGALLATPDETVDAQPQRVADVVDTVGAGDAFSAVALYGLHRGWDRARLLERALSFAAEICRIRGATTDSAALYEQQLVAWGR